MFKPHECGKDNHRFEARYDYEPSQLDFKGRTNYDGLEKLIENSKKQTYVCDICIYCGKTVSRGD